MLLFVHHHATCLSDRRGSRSTAHREGGPTVAYNTLYADDGNDLDVTVAEAVEDGR